MFVFSRGVKPFLSVFLAFFALIPNVNAEDETITKSHAIAMYGTPRHPPGFDHFAYTSLNAKKGGSFKRHTVGTFDSLNPFIAKGTPVEDIGLIYDTLMVAAADEPYTQYGLLAKTIEYPADRSWIIFHIDPNARWHDGLPVTAEDVSYTFKLLIEKGNPFFSYYYADVASVDVLDSLSVKFTFKPNTAREMALIVGQLTVLPKHYWEKNDFSQSSLNTPIGSGPYRVSKVDPGRSISYERVKDYWAREHSTRKGFFNFDRITTDYYRDEIIALEAFKAGEYDFRYERASILWATGYDSESMRKGKFIKEELLHQNPAGMQAFAINLRRPLFQDRILRQAMSLAFDFEWTNKNLFYSAYQRSNSYFSNTELAARQLPTDDELKLLEPYREQLPPEVFTEVYNPPISTGNDRNRNNLRKAKKLLDEAGYKVTDNILYTPDGKPVEFEIILVEKIFERITNPFVKNLSRLGIQAKTRIVDPSQFINRRRSFDYDMTTLVIPQTLSPGNEQRDYWYSESADMEGSQNYLGVKHPVVDAMVNAVINAHSREELLTATHALDRVLLHMHYVVPHWYIDRHRIAYWNKFERPEVSPAADVGYQIGVMTWWVRDPNTSANGATQ